MAGRGTTEGIMLISGYGEEDEELDDLEEGEFDITEQVTAVDRTGAPSSVGVLGLADYEGGPASPEPEDDTEAVNVGRAIVTNQQDEAAGIAGTPPVVAAASTSTPVKGLTPGRVILTPGKVTPTHEDGGAAAAAVNDGGGGGERRGGGQQHGEEGNGVEAMDLDKGMPEFGAGGGGVRELNGGGGEPSEASGAANDVVMAGGVEDELASFLPPPTTEACGDELQATFLKFLKFKEDGMVFNESMKKKKEFRNPDLLQRIVKHLDINQTGSCFSKEIFDPDGLPPEDYFDQLAIELRKEQERKEKERQKKGQMEFRSAGTVMPKPIVQIVTGQKGGGVSAVGPMAAPSARADSGGPKGSMGEARSGKKTKWDKAEPDLLHPAMRVVADAALAVRMQAESSMRAKADVPVPAASQSSISHEQRKEDERSKGSSEKRSDKHKRHYKGSKSP